MQKIQKGYWKDIVQFERLGNMVLLYSNIPYVEKELYYTQYQPHNHQIAIIFLKLFQNEDIIIESFDNIDVICSEIDIGLEFDDIGQWIDGKNNVKMLIKLKRIF